MDGARLRLEAFVKLSERYGVQTCYQIHSGAYIGSNCAGLMHLIRDYLSIVGIKDAFYALRAPARGEQPCKRERSA